MKSEIIKDKFWLNPLRILDVMNWEIECSCEKCNGTVIFKCYDSHKLLVALEHPGRVEGDVHCIDCNYHRSRCYIDTRKALW